MNIIYHKVNGSIKECISIEGYYFEQKRQFVCRIEKIKNHNVFTPIFPGSTIILKNNDDFYSLLKFSSMLIGNSSCGITECGYLKKYVINIGTRQKGRLSGKNVFHVEHNNLKITKQIAKILKLPKLNRKLNVYGNGNSAKKIIKIIKKTSKIDNLIEKKFVQNNI